MNKVPQTNDSFGDRMKDYEAACEQVLTRRLPVILRLDGNSFSKFTKNNGFEKPFDANFETAMVEAAKAVMGYCSGSYLAFVQSDEITIFLRNDQTHQTDPFLANRTQKIASLTAATASVAFNKALGRGTEAIFDCRVFVVPHQEVVNVFRWRQKDAYRNGINMYLYHKLKDKYGRKTAQEMLHGQTTKGQKGMITEELDVHPDNLPKAWLYGRAIWREKEEVPLKDTMDPEKFRELVSQGRIEENKVVVRTKWQVEPIDFSEWENWEYGKSILS